MALINSYYFASAAALTDSVGSAHGTIAGVQAIALQDGVLDDGSSYYFTNAVGTGDMLRVELPRATYDYTGATPFSIEFYVKTTHIPEVSWYETIFSNIDLGGSGLFVGISGPASVADTRAFMYVSLNGSTGGILAFGGTIILLMVSGIML